MQSNVFIRIIETEYRSMITGTNGKWVKNPAAVESYVMNIPEETVARFKQWFKFAMGTTEVFAGKNEITTEEVIAFAATLKSDVPPFEHVYPDILKVIKLFEWQEILDMFGQKLGELIIKESNTV